MRSLLFGPGRCGGSGEAVLQRLSPPPFKYVHASFLHRHHRNLSTSVSATKDIRSAFTDYFKSHGHVHLPSSSLIPHGDDTLLFTNAGMVQFKDHFLGKSPPPHPRLTTVQKCLRAGGKHNDLDNVGHTPRHHTFFEMLGNFSFGDYFKEEAIALAWTFLTKELGLPKERLLVSVHDKDEEAAKIWSSRQGISDDRILRLGDKDNFWSMGDGPGPCGPCTEIYWDQGDAFTGDDRLLELWNVVFMEYERLSNGQLVKLKQPCVDTGMGLERVASVLQNKTDNYDIDVLRHITQGIHSLLPSSSPSHSPINSQKQQRVAFKVIADHVRASAFLMSEGIVPQNVGAGYVLRRIIRRAIRYGHALGLREPFIYRLVPLVTESLSTSGDRDSCYYPELQQREGVIMELLRKEEASFFVTLEDGMKVLNGAFDAQNTHSYVPPGETIPAETVFNLYRNMGFPIELTVDIAREQHRKVDVEAVDRLMQREQALSRERSSVSSPMRDAPSEITKEWKKRGIFSRFTGYNTLVEEHSKVLAFAKKNDNKKNAKKAEDDIWISIDPCPFYGMAGGQVGDKGYLLLPLKQQKEGEEWLSLYVQDSLIPYEGGLVLRIDVSKSGITKNERLTTINTPVTTAQVMDLLEASDGVPCKAIVDREHRSDVTRHHTATHLLHEALKRVLSTTTTLNDNHQTSTTVTASSIVQAGSLVESDKLRFDFTFERALSEEELAKVEELVLDVVRADLPLSVHQKSYQQALQEGAQALFSEKYGDTVRVVEVNSSSSSSSSSAPFSFRSQELCGGTHVTSTGELFPFKITQQSSVSLGIRRIEAVAGGKSAWRWYDAQHRHLRSMAAMLDVSPVNLEGRIKKLLAGEREKEKEIKQLREHVSKLMMATAANQSDDNTVGKFRGDTPLCLHFLEEAEDDKLMQQRAEALRSDCRIHVLISGMKVVCTLDPDKINNNNGTITAAEVLRDVLKAVGGGKGGGRKPTIAQGVITAVNDEEEGVVEKLKRWAGISS